MTDQATDRSNDGKRLFIGFRIAAATANHLAQAAQTLTRRARDLRLDARWVPAVNYHVTLKYLGWTRVDAVTAVQDAVGRAVAGTAPIRLRVSRVGAFPTVEQASVIWAGVVDEGGALTKLAAAIDQACAGVAGLAGLGYRAEPRPFHAHVTLARLGEVASVREAVLPMAEQMFGDTRVDAVTLFESETRSTGSVYRELQRIAFKAAETSGFSTVERQTGAVDLGASKPLGEPEPPDTDDGWPRGHIPTHD